MSCPVSCKLPLDSQGEGGRENEVNVWRALFGSKKETHHSKRPEIRIEVCTPYFNLPSMCVWPNSNCALVSNIESPMAGKLEVASELIGVGGRDLL